MAEAKRMAFILDSELEQQILEMRKQDRFLRSSISEIVRELIRKGLDALAGEEATP